MHDGMRVQADRQLACDGRLKAIRGIAMSVEEYLVSLKTNAMILEIVALNMKNFASQIIQHVNRGAPVDDVGLAALKEKCVCTLKNTAIFAGDFHKHHVMRLAFDEGSNLAVTAAEHEIAFPMPRYDPILNSGQTFTDRNRLDNPTMVICFLGVMARATHLPGTSQVLLQFLSAVVGSSGNYEKIG
jgi:hypothetical protein